MGLAGGRVLGDHGTYAVPGGLVWATGATRESALSVRDTALSTGSRAGATVASSKGGIRGLTAGCHAMRARWTEVEGTVPSWRGREGRVVRLTAEADSVARTDMAARG
jgi:hypothetical protein